MAFKELVLALLILSIDWGSAFPVDRNKISETTSPSLENAGWKQTEKTAGPELSRYQKPVGLDIKVCMIVVPAMGVIGLMIMVGKEWYFTSYRHVRKKWRIKGRLFYPDRDNRARKGADGRGNWDDCYGIYGAEEALVMINMFALQHHRHRDPEIGRRVLPVYGLQGKEYESILDSFHLLKPRDKPLFELSSVVDLGDTEMFRGVSPVTYNVPVTAFKKVSTCDADIGDRATLTEAVHQKDGGTAQPGGDLCAVGNDLQTPTELATPDGQLSIPPNVQLAAPAKLDPSAPEKSLNSPTTAPVNDTSVAPSDAEPQLSQKTENPPSVPKTATVCHAKRGNLSVTSKKAPAAPMSEDDTPTPPEVDRPTSGEGGSLVENKGDLVLD